MNTNRKNVRINHLEKIESFLPARLDFINILKIFIISFTAFYLIGNFVPFYEGDDSSVFGITTINLVEGKYDISNELLTQTGSWDYVPRHWTKTIYETAVPSVNIGLPALGVLTYTLTDYHGLFYIVPILSTIFLISTERISTNLFGRRVGLLTLLFLASNFWILRFGTQYMSDLPFSLIFIIGCFFFVKYLKKINEKYLFLASGLFAIAAFFRLAGGVFFLVEIFIIISFFIYHIFLRNKIQDKTKNGDNISLSIKRSFKIVISIAVPWSLFFLFVFSHNSYYFGDPLTFQLYVTESIDEDIFEQIIKESRESGIPLPENFSESQVVQEARLQGVTLSEDTSRFSMDPENFLGYLRAVLPFPLSHDIPIIDGNEDLPSRYLIGLLTPLLLVSVFFIAFKKNFRLMEIIVFTIFMASIILFYSSISVAESQLERNISQRYAIPAFSLFSIMIGFLIIEIFNIGPKTTFLKNKKLLKLLQSLLVIFLLVFFFIAFYLTPSVQKILDDDFKFKDPQISASRYPIDTEGLTSKNIILDSHGYLTHDYGTIPLRSVGDRIDPEKFYKNPVPQGLILKLENLINSGYEVFVFKIPSREVDKSYFSYITENYNFTLKEHSKTFCKLYLIENMNNITKTDPVCI